MSPVVLIFSREIDGGLTGLVKQIDKVVGESANGVGFLVLLDDNREGAIEKLKGLAQKSEIGQVALTVNEGGSNSPAGYKLNPKVTHTVLVYEKKKVVHNFALSSIGDSEASEILSASKKVLGP